MGTMPGSRLEWHASTGSLQYGSSGSETVHRAYVQAGADVITANTFGANSFKLKPLGYSPEELIRRAVTIAKKSAGSRPVALDVGPLGQLMAPMGTLTFNDAYKEFALQVRAGREAGADMILIETMSDLYEAKAAVLAAKEYTDLPIVCSLTFQKNGRTLMGNDALSAVTVLEGLGVEALGVNCSLGPEELLPVVGEFVKAAHVPVLVQANAGLPELSGGKPLYPLHPESFADSAEKMADMGVKLMGGCCGTNPDFIRMFYERLHNKNGINRQPHVTAWLPPGRRCCLTRASVSLAEDKSSELSEYDARAARRRFEFSL